MQAYIDRYNFEHVPIAGAVDEHAHCTFALHVDKVSPAQALDYAR